MFKDKYKIRDSKCLRGLDFESSIHQNGLAWLPRDLFSWPSLYLHDELVTSTSFSFNGLQGVFRNWKDVNTVNREYCKARDLEYRLQTSQLNDHSDILDHIRKMVYQQFALQMTQQLCINPNLKDTDTELQQGHQGLSFDIVPTLLGEVPYLVQVRRGKHSLGNSYPERVQGLFNWNDDIPHPFWDQCYYRQLARKFYKSILAHVSLTYVEDWKNSLGRQALPFFSIIPHYNKHSLFTRLGKSVNRPAVSRPFITGLCKWKLSEDDEVLCDEGQWLFGGSKYMSGHPSSFALDGEASPEATEDESQAIPTYIIDFGCDVPFTKIPDLIEEGFEVCRRLFANGNPKVLAHYQLARDCLEQCLGDPLCGVLLMILLAFASSTDKPTLPIHSYKFEVGP